jgi:hypothetical protein
VTNKDGGLVMKKTMILVLSVSLIINALLIYRVIDLAVTVSYSEEEAYQQSQRVAELEKLLPLLLAAATREQVERAANKAGLEVMESGDGILVGRTYFSFSGNKVASISLN